MANLMSIANDDDLLNKYGLAGSNRPTPGIVHNAAIVATGSSKKPVVVDDSLLVTLLEEIFAKRAPVRVPHRPKPVYWTLPCYSDQIEPGQTQTTSVQPSCLFRVERLIARTSPFVPISIQISIEDTVVYLDAPTIGTIDRELIFEGDPATPIKFLITNHGTVPTKWIGAFRGRCR